MEEKSNMTAERSLEIITEQIERSRRTVSKHVGQSLFVSGLCTMGMAVVVAIINYLTYPWGIGIGHLSWFFLPFIIWIAMKYLASKWQSIPSDSFIGTLVGKTWWTFAIFTLLFFLFSILYNTVMVRTESAEVFSRIAISPFKIIMLLMGMATTITGHILKQRWLVACGIIGGLGCYIIDTFQVAYWILAHTGFGSLQYMAYAPSYVSCVIIFLFSFVALVLPGYIVKNK